jgi:hypothetical protein
MYSGGARFQEFSGVATFRESTYRVSVIAKGDLWKSEVVKAINRAGGHNVSVDEGKPVTDPHAYANTFAASRISYEVTFTPDNALTEGGVRKPSVTKLLRCDYSIINDGELQKSYGKFKQAVASGSRTGAIARTKP